MGVTFRRLAGLGNFLKDRIPAAFGSNLANIALKGLGGGGRWDLVVDMGRLPDDCFTPP